METKTKRQTDSIFDLSKQQDPGAEMAVLGSMIFENKCIDEVLGTLGPSHFYQTKHKEIFSTIAELHGAGRPVDIITLSDELKRKNKLDGIGGNYYLTELVEAVASAANVEHHAKIVLEKAKAREAITGMIRAVQDIQQGESLKDVLDKVGQIAVSAIPQADEKTFNEGLHEWMDGIDKAAQNKNDIPGARTGFLKLDELTGGYQRGNLVIIAGRPSHGKTAFMVHSIREEAIKRRRPVALFSLEMSRNEINERIVSQEADVDLFALKRGRLMADESARFTKTVNFISAAPIYIDVTPGVSVGYIRAKAKRRKQKHGIESVFVDYLQLIELPEKERIEAAIGDVTRGLKGLAKDLNIPVVLLCQLNRDVEKEHRRPRPSDLRDSGHIEQDADLIIFPWRPNYSKETEQEANQDAALIIGKQRNGPTGSVPIAFKKEFARFETP